MLDLHAIVFKKSGFPTKEDAYSYAKENFNEHLKNKKFVKETKLSFRVRVHPKQRFETKFVSKKISPDITLVFGVMKTKGGAISTEELAKFVDSGYQKKADVQVDGYHLDPELSTRRNKVYVNDKGEAVLNISGTDNAKDWSNNLLIPFGLHTKTNRFRKSEDTLKKVNKKYGKEKTTVVGHSQSGHIVNDLAKKGLVNEGIAYNPAILGQSEKNVKVVKSQFDPVSVLTKTKKGDVVIKPSSYNPFRYNPFEQHSTSPLKNLFK